MIPVFYLLAILQYSLQDYGRTELNVAIAASLQKPFEDLVTLFENTNNIRINLISGSSGMLATQIKNNAPFDIYVSANNEFSSSLLNEKFVVLAIPFCQGGLAWWCKNDIAPTKINGEILSGNIRTIAIANPDLAPYGKVALAWLNKNFILGKSKLVYGENIGSVNRYIYSTSVDAAITSLSSMFAEEINKIGFWFPIETEHDDKLVNVIALVKENPEARKFIDFILGTESRDILKKYGYISIR